ncbi:MAG: nickel pincer cofactor biosynthesis protein LarC [Collinsella sp.]|nr:nickel pincer cofactor biosynthesis protein LarC [Collinsella sp.]
MGTVSGGDAGGVALHLDCQAGVAGDMLVAALLDLGGDDAEAALREALATVPLDGYAIHLSRVSKAGVDCLDFDVELDGPAAGLDHDMDYLHGDHGHMAEEPMGHTGHDHPGASHHADHHHHAAHEHVHRGLADIEGIIGASGISARAKAIATRAFRILAKAEAKAHAVPIEQVHFHEVGAVDSIVDIVSAAVLVDFLGIGEVIVPVLVDGRGTIRCQHGVIPVPVPATLNIAADQGLPLSSSAISGELVTPTGAALVAALGPSIELPSRYRVRRIGLGAGKRSYEVPSILRAMLIERVPAPSSQVDADMVVKIECDIDDSTGERLAYAADLLRDAGAREVHWIAICTKKGRPAHQLQVICSPEDVSRLESLIFRETTTIGLRRCAMHRSVLPRDEVELETPWGTVRGKAVTLPDGSMRVKPEFEDVATIARREGLPLDAILLSATRGARI